MENKKLISILLKDMEDLEGLVSEIKTKAEFNHLEIEFLHTRSKGILQLMQMLNYPPEPEIKTPEEIKETPIEPQIVDVEVEIKTEVEEVVDIPESEEPEPRVELSEENNTEPEETTEKVSHCLGESFTKGKSVNDMVEDRNKLEFKLSNSPVSSIQAAVGINDRFQYIRELFDGSSDKYTETVTLLDSMSNINEAVEYIQQNFKWKKNDTSLKFINLVKRRFANE